MGIPNKWISRASLPVYFIVLICFCISCKKLIEVGPPTNNLTSETVYSNNESAAAVLTGIYTTLSNTGPLRAATVNSLSVIAGLSADELNLYGGAANANQILAQYFQNSLNSGSPTSSENNIWSDFYSKLYTVNLAIERLNASTNLSTVVRQQLLGEAKFIRAFLYFYLVNLFGDVPLATSSDYRIVSTLSRSSKDLVYQQIVADLKDAKELLKDNYVSSDAKTATNERLRPNKFAAVALLSRTYLYLQDWTNAETEATSIISNSTIYDTVPLNNVFLRNNKEAIWQLQPVSTGWNTEDARIFILPQTGPTSNSTVAGYPVYLSSQLVNSFEPDDKRRMNWIDSVIVWGGSANATFFYPYKYKSATLNSPLTEYTMVLRMGEQYLVRAESRAMQNKINDAQADLNMIRARAGLPNTAANDQNSLLNAILHERKVELFTEWGHRWLDLKRTGKIGEVMSVYAPQKGTIWSSDWVLYPIPLYDITQNPNLVQNAGY